MENCKESTPTSTASTTLTHATPDSNMLPSEMITETSMNTHSQQKIVGPQIHSTYYFSNFHILGILDRRCVLRRIYLSNHLTEVCEEPLLELAEQALKSVKLRSSDASPSRDQFLRECFLIWVEDQFKYDTANYKSKMLSCSSIEYYQSANITQFVGFHDPRESKLSPKICRSDFTSKKAKHSLSSSKSFTNSSTRFGVTSV